MDKLELPSQRSDLILERLIVVLQAGQAIRPGVVSAFERATVAR